MRKKQITYDRLATGDRLRGKRIHLGMTQEEIAEKIDRATKYYADIERGNCGMSLETMLALSSCLHMSLDYMIYGKGNDREKFIHTDETAAVMNALDCCTPPNRRYALQMLKLFLAACQNEPLE